MFITQSMHFDNVQQNYLNFGNLTAFNGAKRFVFSSWLRFNINGWPENRILTANYQSVTNGRQFRIITRNSATISADMQISFGYGTSSIQSIYVPKGTFLGKWWYNLIISVDFPNNQIKCFVDGKEIILEGQTGTLPTEMLSNNFATMIGAMQASSPTFFWLGQMTNVAFWVGDETSWLPTLTEAQKIWNGREIGDLRILQNFPPPTYYVPGTTFPPVEVMNNIQPTGIVSQSNELPIPVETVDAMFEHRFEIANGFEPWLGTSNGGDGYYAATPSLALDAQGKLIGSYNRSSIHGAGAAKGKLHRTSDNLTFPIGERAWPLDPNEYIPMEWPYGELSDPSSSRRNFTLTRFPGLGAEGKDRWITPFNEDGWTEPQPDGKMRRLWIQVCDGDPFNINDWYAPLDFDGSGTRWNSVGRARVVLLPDGSMVFGYYNQNLNESRYTSSVARSLDNGLTWSHFSHIIQDPNPNGTPYEEPHLIWLNNELIAFVRVDFGTYTRRILRFVSNDFGATWSEPVDVMVGWQNPVYLYRASDGILISLQRTDANGVVEKSYPMIQLSKDFGLTWSPEIKIPSPFEGRSAQGDFCLMPDNKIAIAWGQDHDITGTSRTRMWFGIFKNCFLETLSMLCP